MKRYGLGFLLAMALLALPANDAGAQADAGCDAMSAAEAQTLLDSQPTYANRDLLDPDGDGVACEPDELASTAPANGCDPAGSGGGASDPSGTADASGSGDDSAAANDSAGAADATTGGAADVADPCDPATARGGSGNGVTVNGLPTTGVGAANPAALVALLAAASALGGVGAAAASRLRARA